MRRLRSDDSGQSLVIVLALVLVATVIGIGLLTTAVSSSSATTHDANTRRALQAADAGVQQQLYQQSDGSSESYSGSASTGGVLGLASVVDCVTPVVNGLGKTINELTGIVNLSGGTCPTGSTKESTSASSWFPLDNNDYYESEFLPNAKTQTSSGGTQGSYSVDFPDVVALGCDTSSSGGAPPSITSGCNGGEPYSRTLAELAPTAPLQTVEGENNVTINNGVSALETLPGSVLQSTEAQLTTDQASLTSDQSQLTTDQAYCKMYPLALTCLLGGVINGLISTLTSTINTLTSTISTLTTELNPVTSLVALTVVDGNITAGNNLSLPANVVDLNTNYVNTGTALEGLLNGAVNLTTGTLLAGLGDTFEYGQKVCSDSTVPATCATTSTAAGVGVLPSATFVQATGGACVAGTPSTSCTVDRPPFEVTTALSATLPSGITETGTLCPTYVAATGLGTSTTPVPSSCSLKFAPGSYVFCNLYSNGTVSTSGAAGAVQIYVPQPGTDGCAATSSGGFYAAQGLNNTVTGLVNNVTGTVDPTAFQIYVAGNSCANPGAPSSSCQTLSTTTTPSTTVTIGTTITPAAAQAFTVYAPGSAVGVDTSAAFTGSVVGWNTTITAATILQDLDLGNYALSPVISNYQVQQELQCDQSVAELTNSTTDTGGC